MDAESDSVVERLEALEVRVNLLLENSIALVDQRIDRVTETMNLLDERQTSRLNKLDDRIYALVTGTPLHR